MELKDIMSFVGLTKRKEVPQTPEQQQTPQAGPTASYGEKVVEYAWTAPDRIVKEIPQKTAKTLIIIAVSVSLLFALMQDFLLIVVIASSGFLYYMLLKSPATELNHEVGSHGLQYGKDQFYYWHQLKQFFFKNDAGNTVLCVDTVDKLPRRVFLNIATKDTEKLKEIFAKRLLFLEEEPKTSADKLYGSAISKFALDK